MCPIYLRFNPSSSSGFHPMRGVKGGTTPVVSPGYLLPHRTHLPRHRASLPPRRYKSFDSRERSLRRVLNGENVINGVNRGDNGSLLSPVESLSQTEFVAETLLPTRHGVLRLRGYRHTVDDWMTYTEPTAIISGDIEGQSKVPLRVHDACFTSEVLGSLKCDCAAQLEIAMEHIQRHPPGMVIYLQQEGRGIGLANKIAAYALQESGLDTVDANRALGFPDDCREYTPVANILKDLDIHSARLMTNNPRKIRILEGLGVKIVDRIPCLVQAGAFNQNYLETKAKRMDHQLEGSWCFWDHDGEPSQPTKGRWHEDDAEAQD